MNTRGGVPMGTKQDPSRFDCYAAARPDEHMFVLLDRDPLAPFLVSIWSSVRIGDPEAARAKFEAMLQKFALRYMAEPDVDKASEALDCAMLMFHAQEERR